jgi:hypothetical protein
MLINMHITDKSGKKYWRTQVAAEFAQGERNNLNARLAQIKKGNKAFAFVDQASARIVEESEDTAFVSALESRSMSTWTDEELRRYSLLTGQVTE